MAMNFETSLLSNSKLESNGSAKPHHTKMDDSASSNFEVKSITADEALEDLEERREMLRQFLQRSLSQSAKSSQMQIKPAGYHLLKQDGKLPFYQRQQSKPEQGVLVRRESSNVMKPNQPKPRTQLPKTPTKSLKIVSETHEFSSTAGDQSEKDGETIQTLSTLNKMKTESKNLNSSDSISSDEDNRHQLRRKSFHLATRKSVISFIESNKQKVPDGVLAKDEKLKGKTQEDEPSLPGRELSLVENETYQSHVISDDGQSTIEKRNTFGNRIKKVMATTSNKKKSKYKKSIEIPQLDECDMKAYRIKTPSEPPTADADVIMRLEVERSPDRERRRSVDTELSMSVISRHSSSLKRKPPSEVSESSDSPPKNKSTFPPKLVRSLSRKSSKGKRSSKIQNRLSSSLNELTSSYETYSGDASENKSGSLPMSVAYRSKLRQKPERSASFDPKNSNQVQPDTQDRPNALDLSGRKKGGKWKRFFRPFWKQKSRSSQTNLFHSHPPVITEKQRKEDADEKQTNKRLKESAGDNAAEQRKCFHHRGSNSFSPGDKLTAEKKRIYEEFVETLDRVSSHYSRHMHSRSSTPGSRINTPESSLSSSDYYSYAKGIRSGPPSRQSSNLSIKYPGGVARTSSRQSKEELRPALAAFNNLRSQQNSDHARGTAATRGLYRRHTHHSQVNVRHRHERHRKVVADSCGVPASPMDTTDDSGRFIDAAPLPSSRKSSSSSDEDDDCDDVVDGVVSDSFAPPALPPVDSFHPTTSSRNGFTTSGDDELEKLAQEIARIIRSHGDRLNVTVNTPDIPVEPMIRDATLRYLREQTYSGFQHFAGLLFRHLADTNLETLPIVVAFNMSRFLCSFFTNPEGGVMSNIIKYSADFLVDMLDTNAASLSNLTAQLQATEEEISRCESTEESPSDYNYFYEVD